MSLNAAVRSTDDDAASMRLSATELGYLTDPFAQIFHPTSSFPSHASGGGGPGPASRSDSGSSSVHPLGAVPGSTRKPPLINIGTHHRTWAIDLLLDRFLEAAGPDGGQVVSLGAGSDTRFFRYMDRPHPHKIKRYIEIDFPSSTSRKIKQVTSSPRRLPLLATRNTTPDMKLSHHRPEEHSGKHQPEPTTLMSPIFCIIPMDLEAATSSSSSNGASDTIGGGQEATGHRELQERLLPLLDPNVPTLFLAECVFCYMSPTVSQGIIDWFGRTFESCTGIIYEMMGTDDTFGQVMKRNLSQRGLSIPGAEPYKDVKAEAARFTGASTAYSSAGAKTLWDIRKSVIDKEELQRISKLEILDELEELKLVLSHYMIAWGSKGFGGQSSVKL